MTYGVACDENHALYFSWCMYSLLHIIILSCVGKIVISASPESETAELQNE